MKLINKNILLISPEPWDHIFVSKHHYSIHLANRGNKVFFLNPPGSKIYLNFTGFNNVWKLSYRGFPIGIRYYPYYLQSYFIKKTYKKLEKSAGVKFDVVWSFDNSVFFNFDILPRNVFKISHLVDLNQDFQLVTAAKTANICFAVSNNILDRLIKYQKNSFFINHGYSNYKHKQKIILPGENKMKALLIGNLSMAYLDWKILYYSALENERIDFIFYGPNSEEFSKSINPHHNYKKKLFKLNNSYFPGKVASETIPNILKSADILLVSYQELFQDYSSNSHKIMEYFGSGKMILATKTTEYLSIVKNGLIAMSDHNKDFSELLRSIMENIDHWNSKDLQEQRKAYALQNTYDNQIERIEKLISEHVFK